MEKEKIAPHVDDIYRVLEKKVDRHKIELELENYVNTYRVGLDVAKRSIVKKYGGKISALSIGTNKTLTELVPNEQSVDILCKVLSVNLKEIDVQGVKKQIYYGLVSDGTDTLPYTAWETESFTVLRGDVIRAYNAYTNAKEWNEKPQLNFGIRTKILKEPKEKLSAFENIQVNKIPAKKYSIKELSSGLRNVFVTARILSIEKKDIKINDQSRTIFSGSMGDSSGQIQFSAWNDFDLHEDDCITISNAYVSGWRGLPQLNFDTSSTVEKIKDNNFAKRDTILNTPPVYISEILKNGGALAIAVRGIVVDIKNGSGLIFRCPECKRVTNKGECKLHGRVDPTPDLRTKAVVDDGTGTVTVIMNRAITERILEKNLEDCIKIAKDSMNPDRIHDDIVVKLLTTHIQVRGTVTSDDFGLTMIATELEHSNIDIQKEAQTMLNDLEQG